MSETSSSTISAGSPWPRRLAIFFGVVVVLAVAGYFVLKAVLQNYIADKIEEEFGLRPEVGELNFSLKRKELEVKDFTGLPTTAKAKEGLGTVSMDYGKVRFDESKKDGIAEMRFNGLKSKRFSADKINVVSGQLFYIEQMKIKQPAGFGDGSMFELKSIRFENGKAKGHYKEVRLDVGRINIVRNADGKLNIGQPSKMQGKIDGALSESGKAPAIDHLTIAIGEATLLDVASGELKVVPVNHKIEVVDAANPRAYQLIVGPKLVWMFRKINAKLGL